MLEIRAAEPRDAPGLADLLSAFALEGHQEIEVELPAGPLGAEHAALLATAIRAQGGEILLAEQAGAIQGFLLLTSTGPERAGLTMGVRAGSRGQRIGTALLTEAVVRSRAQGMRAIELVVRPDNMPAVALYRSAGFQVVPDAAPAAKGRARMLLELRSPPSATWRCP
jgi:ribosomal protein S18 acetylase RimI-like enzyme